MNKQIKKLVLSSLLTLSTLVPTLGFSFPNMKMYPHDLVKMQDFGSPKTYASKSGIPLEFKQIGKTRGLVGYDPTTDSRVGFVEGDSENVPICVIVDKNGKQEISDGIFYTHIQNSEVAYFLFGDKGGVVLSVLNNDIYNASFYFQTFNNKSKSKNI